MLAVGLGALGAHAFKEILSSTPTGTDLWKTAAHYHLVHAVALYFLAERRAPWAYWLMVAGIVAFSGSLYLYSVTHWKFLVAITPVGGILLIAAWGVLAFARRHLPERS